MLGGQLAEAAEAELACAEVGKRRDVKEVVRAERRSNP